MAMSAQHIVCMVIYITTFWFHEADHTMYKKVWVHICEWKKFMYWLDYIPLIWLTWLFSLSITKKKHSTLQPKTWGKVKNTWATFCSVKPDRGVYSRGRNLWSINFKQFREKFHFNYTFTYRKGCPRFVYNYYKKKPFFFKILEKVLKLH